jgi:methylthioribose-1-phosphate isomerase
VDLIVDPTIEKALSLDFVKMANILSACTGVERPVFWRDNTLWLIDQKILPAEFKLVQIHTVDEVILAIKDMTVRGAPAIGVAGAFGLVIHSQHSNASTNLELLHELVEAKKKIDSSRPTAVNLMWATGRILDLATSYTNISEAHQNAPSANLKRVLLSQVLQLAEQDVEINLKLANFGNALVKQNDNIMHICNTGAVATIDYGTALGVIYRAHQEKKNIHVWINETRPRLQGSKLTAWELTQAKIPCTLHVDSAAGLLFYQKKVDIVLFGADRVAANGDVANKVGTMKLSVLAHEFNVPVYACVPTSTIDLETLTGSDIHIEERNAEEVTVVGTTRLAPMNVKVFNPAFDITPAKYLTGIITEMGVCYPPFNVSLKDAKERAIQQAANEWKSQLEAILKAE